MFTNALDSTRYLTPSELVYLYGEQFADKVLLGNNETLFSGEKVSTAKLGKAMVLAALLACEQAGAVRLEIGERKGLFGLTKVQDLFAMPGTPSQPLPPHSLEAEFAGLAQQWAPKNANTIYHILFYWLGRETASPWFEAVEEIKRNMHQRGLLEATTTTRLKIFTNTTYSLPESTAALMKGQSPQGVKAMLENCQRTRPEIWKRMEKSIQKAISARTESSNDD